LGKIGRLLSRRRVLYYQSGGLWSNLSILRKVPSDWMSWIICKCWKKHMKDIDTRGMFGNGRYDWLLRNMAICWSMCEFCFDCRDRGSEYWEPFDCETAIVKCHPVSRKRVTWLTFWEISAEWENSFRIVNI
jgi:hypothetical protein